ncbi:MAG TPA: ATP-binding cassette domain-containing protein, partial [Planctomycetota bacterium]|nr:ATP-binding cassette domain-containing protein [Planctomycetota bacterium]
MEPSEFEAHVRNIAKLRWPGFEGGPENIAGTQVDIVLRKKTHSHLIEVTIEHSMDKVRTDIVKLTHARSIESRSAFVVECWLVVLRAPTSDQRAVAHSERVELMTHQEFAASELCNEEYAYRRNSYPFGSVSDPVGSAPAADVARVETPIVRLSNGTTISVGEIASALRSGESVVLLGEYGAGKSLLCRELYRRLVPEVGQISAVFPISVNLRDHWGSVFAHEIFTRHAQLIGMTAESGTKLYAAWRAGFVATILDGFDELAPQPWSFDRTSLGEVRRRATAAIRDLINQHHGRAGVLVAG